MIQKKVPQSKRDTTEWIISDIAEKSQKGIRIAGKPAVMDCKYGKALTFDGSADAIFLDSMPLTGLIHFTIELIIQPFSGGNFEQRFLHFGEVQGYRVLLELRSTPTDWYFDAFVKAGDQQCTLIDPGLLHPLNQWYHLAYVINNGKLETFVNGKKELEGHIVLAPLKGDITSIGVRQNEISWFKGAIYKISITNKALKPLDFMTF
jgi:hypothetical protein